METKDARGVSGARGRPGTLAGAGLALALSLPLAGAGGARAAVWSHPGCPDVDDARDFAFETLVKRGQAPDQGLLEPVKLAIGRDPEGGIEVYYAERKGNLKVWRERTRAVDLVHAFKVYTGDEDGLLGVALDPGFAANRRMWFMYSVLDRDVWRISRMTLGADRKSLSDERIVYEIPVQKEDCCHTGGGLAFDDIGDLWITVGNNEGRGTDGINETNRILSGEWGASSTASARGGVLRIRPTADGRYTIPKGNFWEHFAERFEKEGKPELARTYRDSARVKREIYVKGNRNPYTIALDPARRWVGYGDVGPDGNKPDSTGLGEEYNLHLAPAFAGWPYFAGNNRNNAASRKDPAAPINTSRWNTGAQTLPPAERPLLEERNAANIAGPIYRFRQSLASAAKLPPHFHRHWFLANWSGGDMRVVRLGDDGRLAPGWTAPKKVFGHRQFHNVVEVKEGPDGALYVIHYAGFFASTADTRIERIAYKGAECAADIPWEKAGCKAADPSVTHDVPESCAGGTGLASAASARGVRWAPLSVGPGARARLRVPAGARRVLILALDGRRALAMVVPGNAEFLEAPAGLAPGIYRLQWE